MRRENHFQSVIEAVIASHFSDDHLDQHLQRPDVELFDGGPDQLEIGARRTNQEAVGSRVRNDRDVARQLGHLRDQGLLQLRLLRLPRWRDEILSQPLC